MKFSPGSLYFEISQKTGQRILNILEIYFSFGGVRLSSSSLRFSSSSLHYSVAGKTIFGAASLANDGLLTTCFHSSTSDANPYLRVVVPYCIDAITIYRRTDCCMSRLDGAVVRIFADSARRQTLYTHTLLNNTPAITKLTLQLPSCVNASYFPSRAPTRVI